MESVEPIPKYGLESAKASAVRHTSSVTAIGALALLKLSPEVQISMSCPSEYVGTPSAKTAKKICCGRDGVHVFGGLAWVWAVWPVQLVIWFNWPRRQIRSLCKAMFRSLVTLFLIIVDPNGSVPTTSKSECKRSHKPSVCVCACVWNVRQGLGFCPAAVGIQKHHSGDLIYHIMGVSRNSNNMIHF